MARIHPKTWADGVGPLDEFPASMRADIAEKVAQPRPPSRWLSLSGGLALLESRAWWEWHWARGLKLWDDGDPGPERRKLPAGLRAQVIARDGMVCGICGDPTDPADIHIDHVYPWSLGGPDDLDNLQVSHPLCNIRKGNRV